VVDLHRIDLHVEFKNQGILSLDAKPFPAFDGNPNLALGPFSKRLSVAFGKNFSLFFKKMKKGKGLPRI
jgi:hypothetical protein